MNLLQALSPFGLDVNNAVPTLLSTAGNDSAQAGILCVLDRLAVVAPEATLEVSEQGLDTALLPVPWSLRWCILAGSLCDLANNRSSRGAAFWNGLLSITTSPRIHKYVDMWGDARTPDVEVMHRDSTGEVWGKWLAAAVLSGMMQQEQVACMQHLAGALIQKCGASQAMPQFVLAAAVNMVNCAAGADVSQGCRVAICSVITISVYGIACSQVCHQFSGRPCLDVSVCTA